MEHEIMDTLKAYWIRAVQYALLEAEMRQILQCTEIPTLH